MSSSAVWGLSRLEKFPEIFGRMKPKLDISVVRYWKGRYFFDWLDLSSLENLVALPSSIGLLKSLVKLNLSGCSKFESLPEEIGDLENLEELDASYTLIPQPPSSIIRLNKLKSLSFAKQKTGGGLVDGANFVFPHINKGLRSLEDLDLSYCNLIDGGLPEDIGSLSSLKELNLKGINNFEHLPRSITQLGALRSLDLSECWRLTQLPELPQHLHTIYADWSNDSICNSLFQNISSFKHDNISDSHSRSLRVFTSWSNDSNSLFKNILSFSHDISASHSVRVFSSRAESIPSWFHHQGIGTSVSFNLPENWYVSDNFLGFAVCYMGTFVDITAYLMPLCDDRMTQKLALSNHSEYTDESADIHFFLIPLAGLWDESKANGKTPNDYQIISLVARQKKKFGVRLLYKDEAELCVGIRRSRREEASCSSSKKQRS